jgi:hypothetical protein
VLRRPVELAEFIGDVDYFRVRRDSAGIGKIGWLLVRNRALRANGYLPVEMITEFSTIRITVQRWARLRRITPFGTTNPCRDAIFTGQFSEPNFDDVAAFSQVI